MRFTVDGVAYRLGRDGVERLSPWEWLWRLLTGVVAVVGIASAVVIVVVPVFLAVAVWVS